MSSEISLDAWKYLLIGACHIQLAQVCLIIFLDYFLWRILDGKYLDFISYVLCQRPSSRFLPPRKCQQYSAPWDLQGKYFRNGKTHRQHFSEPLCDSLGQIFRGLWAWQLCCEGILFYRILGTTQMPEGAWPT